MPLRRLCIATLTFAVVAVSVRPALAQVVAPSALAGRQEFQKNNPDIGKYEFGRSYISALGYIDTINKRWKKSSPKKTYAGDDVKIMRGYVSLIVKDNADLRIAKNYLQKYLESPNLLVRKTADLFISGCMTQIAVNDKEKQIWDQWYAVKSNDLDTQVNERAFVKAQNELSLLRKESNKMIVEATVLLTKVLKSSQNPDEKGHLLAVTAQQRSKLLENLDVFGKGHLDWGLKPGQDHVTASVAVLREVLEDSIYTSLK